LLLDVLMFFSLLESVLGWVSAACFLLLVVSEDAAWESGCISDIYRGCVGDNRNSYVVETALGTATGM